MIMRIGEPGDFFCFIVEGELQVSRDGQNLRTLGIGECLGEMSVATRLQTTRTADVSARESAAVVSIRHEALELASDSCRMRFYQGFVETLSRRLLQSDQRWLRH